MAGIESDLLLDDRDHARVERGRVWRVTGFSLLFFLLYALALVLAIASVGSFAVADAYNNSTCILYSNYSSDDNTIYCDLHYGGESLLVFLCLVLLVLSILRLLYGRWSCCFVVISMILLVLALLVGISVGLNALIGHIKSDCDKDEENCSLLSFSELALLVCYTTLCISTAMEILFLLCQASSDRNRRRNPGNSRHTEETGNPWIDEGLLMHGGRNRAPPPYD